MWLSACERSIGYRNHRAGSGVDRAAARLSPNVAFGLESVVRELFRF
jgi:hypothetical protein